MTEYPTSQYVLARFENSHRPAALSLPMASRSARSSGAEIFPYPVAPHPGFPAYSLQIGTCTDGLPFLLDLQDPTAGSVLVTAETGAGKTHLLRSLAQSAVRLNTAREVQYTVITSRPDEWADLEEIHLRSGHCRGIYSPGEPSTNQVILEMSVLAEQRREGNGSGPVILLLIDDLDPLLDADYTVQVNLHWLFDQGPQSRIWPVLAIESERAFNLHYWVNLFRTRLIGAISSPLIAQQLAIRPGVFATRLEHGKQFTAWIDGRWVKFWLTGG